MSTYGKLACLTIIITVTLSGFLVINEANATNIASLITADTTWTLTGSPYTLTGPTAVNKGVTLTIEPGVVVNLNDYYIQVNGTLIASGTDTQHIIFNGGRLTFTAVSNGWNQQTGIGNRIEYAEIDQTSIESGNALKLFYNTIKRSVTVGSGSLLSDNAIAAPVNVGSSSKVTGNTITGSLFIGDKTVISNNKVEGPVTTGSSCTISGNTITNVTPSNTWLSSDDFSAVTVGQSSIVSNNIIEGTLTGTPSEVRGNTIEGGGEYSSFFGHDSITVYAVKIDSTSCIFTSNTVWGKAGAAISAHDGTFVDNNIRGGVGASTKSTFQHNTITGYASGGDFRNNRIYGLISTSSSNPTIVSNYIEDGGIYCQPNASGLIKDNIIIRGGISEASGTIQNNLITEGEGTGITTGTGTVSIESNTISKKSLGISVGTGQATIKNNNIESNNQSLSVTGSSDVTAIDNWWGITDEQAISNSIHDFKNDFNLGTVNYRPFLTAPNPQAEPITNMDLPDPTPISTPTPASSSSTPSGSRPNLTLALYRIFGILLLVGLIVSVILVIVLVLQHRKTGKIGLPRV